MIIQFFFKILFFFLLFLLGIAERKRIKRVVRMIGQRVLRRPMIRIVLRVIITLRTKKRVGLKNLQIVYPIIEHKFMVLKNLNIFNK
jgi:hypothetical protein